MALGTNLYRAVNFCGFSNMAFIIAVKYLDATAIPELRLNACNPKRGEIINHMLYKPITGIGQSNII